MSALTLYQAEDWIDAYLECVDTVSDEERNDFERDLQQALSAARGKRDSVGRYIISCIVAEENIDDEIDRLRQRQAMIANRKKRLENLVIHLMEERGVKKLEGNVLTMSLSKNPDRVEITNEDLIPKEYIEETITVQRRPKKAEIKKAIADGKKIPGADVIFGSSRLTVR